MILYGKLYRRREDSCYRVFFVPHKKLYLEDEIRATKILRILGLRPGFESGFFALFS